MNPTLGESASAEDNDKDRDRTIAAAIVINLFIGIPLSELASPASPNINKSLVEIIPQGLLCFSLYAYHYLD